MEKGKAVYQQLFFQLLSPGKNRFLASHHNNFKDPVYRPGRIACLSADFPDNVPAHI